MTEDDSVRVGDVDVDSVEYWIGRDCPECGVEINVGSIRYNGFGLEHKNPEAHPQAGHHVIIETVPGGGDA